MGLAERFKTEFEKQNIFSQNNQSEPSGPKDNVIGIKKFENLETDTIAKIRRTPNWQDYPIKSREKMIEKYFDNKIKSRYSNIDYTPSEKIGFIHNILTLSNNR